MRTESGTAPTCLKALFALIATTAVAVAQADGPPQRIIVKYKPAMSTAQGAATAARDMSDTSARFGVGMRTVRRMTSGASVMSLDRELPETDYQQLVADIGKSANVEYAEPDRILRATLTPNDTYYSQQWHYYESAGGINVPGAWDSTNGAGVTVAVIDTGYRPHTDLAANIVGGYDFISDTFVSRDGDGRDSDALDPGDWTESGDCGSASDSSWHGTHVSGTIAAVTNNGKGVAGVAYGAKVLPVRVLGRCGGYTSDIADGLAWASGASVSGVPSNSHPARVANLSLGGSGSCSTTMQNAIDTARSNGMVVVVAAGNSSRNASNATPANCSGVVVVAALGRSGGRASYSNYGSIVDIAAPGGSSGSGNGVLSTLNDGTTTPGSDAYAYYQGTSMATPHVAGVAALMLSVNSSLTPAQVESKLKSTARAFSATCSQCGAGVVDASAAVSSAASATSSAAAAAR